ncbi:MAG: putative bifunctional diguanylate cyclase/phosphodiesterase [Nitriliruptoraceae bacterium]
MAPWVWKLAALAGVAAGVGFLTTGSPLLRESLWLATLVMALVGILVGLRWNRPSRYLPWGLLAAALATLVLANVTAFPLWATASSLAWSDVLAIAAFPLIGIGTLTLSRAQVPGGDRESAIDGAIVMVAMAAVLSGTAHHPELLQHDVALATRLLHTVVAPLMMAAVTAAALRLLFTGGARLPAAWFVVGAAFSALLGNAFRAVLVAAGAYERGTPSDLLILAAYVLIGLAGLHPSAAPLTRPAAPPRRRFTAARLAVLGGALVATPVTVLLRGVDSTLVPTLLGSVVVSCLVLVRISRLALERQGVQEQLRRAAVHDPLTGLPNRRLILDRLAQGLARSARDGGPVAVMFVDLDDFKRVNDDRGHQVGDEVLVAVARRLEGMVRDSDTVGRFAGDEFVLLCETSDDDAAAALAQRVLAALVQPFPAEGRPVRIGASIGLTVPASGSSDPEEVLKQADDAMYLAKARVGPAVACYDRSLAAHQATRRTLERELEQAVERQELRLVYQPLWRLDRHHMIGAEALLRWAHPTRGELDPSTFLPIAERTDLILAVGDLALAQACAQLQVWQAELPPEVDWTLYVNLAGRQLVAPTLVDRVAGLLDAHGLRPDRLGFEVSERAVVDDRVVATASALHRLGTRLSWDDFGTGYSSISHLRGWPLDIIKLDGSLVLGAVDRPEDAGIVRAVCSVAHELGIAVLAEHVASPEVLATVQRLGCELGQGYHLGRPVPAAQLSLRHVSHVSGALTDPPVRTLESTRRSPTGNTVPERIGQAAG